MGKWLDKQLSSNSYIQVLMRYHKPGERPTPLIVRAPYNCGHTEDECCETAECLNSWSLDYMLLLRRTIRGRKIIEQFHLTDEQVKLLESDQIRPVGKQHDPFDAQYDRVSMRRAGPPSETRLANG